MDETLLSKAFVLCLLALGNLDATPLQKVGPRIIGGHDTKIEDHPYQVGLIVDNEFSCGASIISPTWLLTAAHCVYVAQIQNSTIQVFANSTEVNSGIFIYANQSIYHEKFIYGLEDYDIGLIQVSEPLKCVNCKPIDLDTAGPKLNQSATITGWGKINEMDLPEPHKILQKATVRVLNQTLCEEWYLPKKKYVTERMFCAGYAMGGIDACEGDSGGPIVIGGKLAGVTSWGIGCAEPKFPGVYTKVTAYLDWIKEHSGIGSSK
ncbi:unnamed protein product [Callosobruchus maculatus]|uniref:Peptidase S1 domain-containing protein n=1 Tax=Callosobruchus maculatus TaxID=64391 RepID=A0A653CAQ9_CALMS|nr:unnamed protein product [Callosobruchus maculatus]